MRETQIIPPAPTMAINHAIDYFGVNDLRWVPQLGTFCFRTKFTRSTWAWNFELALFEHLPE